MQTERVATRLASATLLRRRRGYKEKSKTCRIKLKVRSKKRAEKIHKKKLDR